MRPHNLVIISLFVFVLFFSSSVLAPGIEYGYDECEYSGGWSEPVSAAQECGWPPGAEGFKVDCCCCYLTSHIHDMGMIYPPSSIEIKYMPGFNQGCTSIMKVYYSEDGESWTNFYEATVTQETWSPKTKYTKTLSVPDNFRYIKIYIPSCYVDTSSARVLEENQTTTTTQTTSTVETTTTADSWFCNDTDWFGSGDEAHLLRLMTKGTCTDDSGSHTDFCIDSNKLKDYTCEPLMQEPKSCGYTTYYCTGYGFDKCENGACVYVNETTTTIKECYDSDGGKSYYVKGYAKDSEGKSWDICIVATTKGGKEFSSDYVFEKYCKDGQVHGVQYHCPNGCKDGACISEAEEEPGYDMCEYNGGWSEPTSAAKECGWPPGEEGYKVDCCCCYLTSHIHDMGKVYSSGSITIEYMPGWNKGCTSTLYVYYSKDGKSWENFHKQTVTQETWSPKTTYKATLSVPNYFRYIRIHIPECYVDYSSVRVFGVEEEPPEEEETTEEEEEWEPYEKCNGCVYNYKCLAYGTRILYEDISSYCNLDDRFVKQKENEASCMNNYECKSNFCSDGECYDIKGEIQETRGVLELIVDFLRKMFLFGD